MQPWNMGSDFMNLSKLLCEMDVNARVFDKPQELMCFALVLCHTAYISDAFKSGINLNFLSYRCEMELDKRRLQCAFSGT